MTSFPAKAFSSERDYQASLAELAASTENDGPIAVPKPGDAYYIEGAALRTGSWETKRAQLQANGAQTVRLSAGEMNAWMNARFRPGSAPEGSEKASILIVPGTLNVAITEEGVLCLNLPIQMTTRGKVHNLVVFARALPSGTGIRFETVHINSAKVPLPDLFGRRVFETLLQSFQSTEDYKIFSNALTRAESIAFESGEFVLALR